MLRALVFDLDDTLYPEQEYLFSGYLAVARWGSEHLGIPIHEGHSELVGLYRSGKRHHLFNYWLNLHDMDSEELALELVQIYRLHTPSISMFPGVAGLLEEWHNSFRLGMVSDGLLATQELKLATLRIADAFDTIVLSDRWGQSAWKPSTRPFEAALEALRVEPFEAVYVGDNPLKDFIGARQIGMHTVRVLRFGGLYSEIEPPTFFHAPDHLIFGLADLQGVTPNGLAQPLPHSSHG